MRNMLVLSLLFFTQGLFAQSWGEWFDQNSTQKKYLLQQIVALKIYTGYAAKGYGIVKNGLGIIGRIRQGDLSMHRDYFSSLTTVNPLVKKYSNSLAIVSMQANMIKQANTALQKLRIGKELLPTEQEYIRRVISNLFNHIASVKDALFKIINSGNLQMKDDERIKIIGQLYIDTQAQQSFLSSFTKEAMLLLIQRSNEEKEINLLRKLN